MTPRLEGTYIKSMTDKKTTRELDPRWEIGKIIVQFVGVALIPVVIASVGFALNAALSEREANQQMVILAIDILKTQPDISTQDSALREWAIEVLDEFSRIPLNTDAKRILLNEPLIVGELPNQISGLRYEIAIKATIDVKDFIATDRLTNRTLFEGDLVRNQNLEFSGSYSRFTWANEPALDSSCSNLDISYEVYGQFISTPSFEMGKRNLTPADVSLDNDRCELNIPDFSSGSLD